MFNLVRHIFNAIFLLYNTCNTFHIHVSTKVEGVVSVIVMLSCACGSIIYST